MNRFEKLAAIDCREHTEKKNGLSYLSWAWAWDAFKRVYPDSFFTIYERPDGCIYWTDGRSCWVKTGVTLVDGDYRLEHIEYLPIMDYRNASIPLERVTSRNVNDTIQRSLTKAVARHGLGLYIYAGEDLPPEVEEEKSGAPSVPAVPEDKPIVKAATPAKPVKPAKPAKISVTKMCSACGKPITGVASKAGGMILADDLIRRGMENFGMALCLECYKERRKAKAE